MTAIAILLAAALLGPVEKAPICAAVPDTTHQRLTCCVDPDGRQCCSGIVEDGKPLGCECVVTE